jgi:hypothetical protein
LTSEDLISIFIDGKSDFSSISALLSTCHLIAACSNRLIKFPRYLNAEIVKFVALARKGSVLEARLTKILSEVFAYVINHLVAPFFDHPNSFTQSHIQTMF